MNIENSTFNISTAVAMGLSNSEFDINAIYTHLELSDEILSVKCNNREKIRMSCLGYGEKPCKTFYNQVSVSLKNGTSIKLFNNGKFHISGIKNLKVAKEKISLLFDHIKNLNGIKLVSPVSFSGLFIYENKILTKVGSDTYRCSHIIKNDRIIINNKKCMNFDLIPGCFIEERHTDKKKKIYNIFAQQIGFAEYSMIRKNKNLCIKDCKYVKNESGNYDVINKYNNVLGEFIVVLDETKIYLDPIPNKVKLLYNCCSENPDIVNIDIVNINSNLKNLLNKDTFFNRQNICDILKEMNIDFCYDPCIYPGIKIVIKDTKITIFRTGSVLFYSQKEPVETVEWLKNFFKTNEKDIIDVKHLINDKNTKELNIWDVLN